MLAIKKEVLDKLLQDKELLNKLEKVKTLEEIDRLIVEHAKKKGYKILELRSEQHG